MKLLEKIKIDLIVDSRIEYRKAILSLLEENREAVLLDLGCSFEQLTRSILDKIKPRKAVGVDIDENTVVQGRGLGVEVYIGNLNEKLPFGREFADIVVASHIIEHLNSTDLFVEEIRRVLKPTGYAIISTPNLAAWHNVFKLTLGKQPDTAMVSDKMYPERGGFGHRRVFTKEELVKFLEFHGWKVERVLGTSYYPFTGWLGKVMCKLDDRHVGIVTTKIRREGIA